MRFLVDADLPRRVLDLLHRHGHEAEDVRDIGRGDAPDEDIAAYAQSRQACLLTADRGIADVRNYPPERYFGVVVLRPPKDATAEVIANLVESLVRQRQVLERVPGRLAVVEPGRVRMRPAAEVREGLGRTPSPP